MSNDATQKPAVEEVIPTFSAYQRMKKVNLELTKGVPASQFTVKELSGSDRQAWQEEERGRYANDYNGQLAGLAKFQGREAALIGRCLFDANDRLVPVSVIQGWPSSTQAALYQMCLQLNSISEKDIAKLKVD